MRVKNKIKISEGELFSIPLCNGALGIGLVIRVNEDKLLAFFLRGVYDNIPTLQDIAVDEKAVVYRVLSSRLGFNEQKWKIIGKLDGWERDQWPVPVFYQKDSIEDFYWRVTLDDQLNKTERIIVDKSEVPENAPTPGLGGYDYVEKVLAKHLSIQC